MPQIITQIKRFFNVEYDEVTKVYRITIFPFSKDNYTCVLTKQEFTQIVKDCCVHLLQGM